MKPQRTRRCRQCGRRFKPEFRNVHHQRFCSATGCRTASRRASQRRWWRKPANRSHFCGAEEVNRVRRWRHAHPGYWRTPLGERRCASTADLAPAPSAAPAMEARTLQDVCRHQSARLTGLISRLSGSTLQEDIASCAQELVSAARWILAQCQSKVRPPIPTGLPTNYHESG